jgi:putative sigma-54 modulation protein
MEITVTFRHMEPTDALRNYAIEKVTKLTRYVDKMTEANVILSLEKHRHIAEVTINANRITINGRDETNDMHSAIDLVMDKIERQVKKYKDKIRNHKPSPHVQDINARINVLSSESIESIEGPRVVRTKTLSIKPMSVEEAVMQLDLLNNDFFIFSNASNQKVSVIYRRKDGDYGLIEPEVQ